MPYAVDALAGKLVLVAEDDYLLADTIVASIQSAGGAVLGPFASAKETVDRLKTARCLDAAILNVFLEDGVSYPVADDLVEREIPFLFASANKGTAIPSRFHPVPMLTKPYAASQIVNALLQITEP